MNRILAIFLVISSCYIKAMAADGVVGEAEAGLVVVSGNSKSESTSAKAKTTYALGLDSYTAGASYLRTKSQLTGATSQTETARAWDAGLRYERSISDRISAFLGQKAESTEYAGYVQRDSTDLGLKYFFTKDETKTGFAELGARSTKTNTPNVLPATTNDVSYTSYTRIYGEWSHQVEKTWSYKLWVEYLPNNKDSDAYQLNHEASLSVMMSQMFSLKSAYLTKYQNKVATGIERTDAILTTSLVAKF